MNGPPEAALDDIRRRLDELQREARRASALGRATLSALAVLSDETRQAVEDAVRQEAEAMRREASGPMQEDLFEAFCELQALATPEGRLARDLEQALIDRAAGLDGEPIDLSQRKVG
ncbi:hypothetical protein [Phenylobacterium sp.]|uniref:hypothetical protein n=1 Tax=Phenylobacterium sp. TaxID=1871053 RepID=UPI002731BD72|nr:hypothetical protein [Phenylobacterium sp.]MDP1618981.1 hypothetical protein [Phenylobacterium sp.]MDP1989303.1 hypothetical protein [Phenylobacterium sp.]